MKKNKYYKLSLNKANIGVNLLNLRLSLEHLDVFEESGIIPFSVTHTFSNDLESIGYGKGFNINLNQQLKRLDDGTYKHIDSLNNETIFKEKYYYSDGMERIYKKEDGSNILKSDISIEDDGTLTYMGKRVFVDCISDNGLKIKTSYEGFKNSNEFELRDEEIANLDLQINNYKQSLYSLKQNKLSLENEISYDYKKMLEYQKLVEEKSNLLNETNYGQQINLKYYNTTLNTYKNNYYNLTKKELKNTFGVNKAANRCYTSEDKEKYMYSDSDGERAEKFSQMGQYHVLKQGDDYSNLNNYVNQYDNKFEENFTLYQKWAAYYGEEFNKKVDEVTQQINDITILMENQNLRDQGALLDAQHELYSAQQMYQIHKNSQLIESNESKELLEDLNNKLLEVITNEIDLYEKIVKQLEYKFNEYVKQAPVNFIVDEQINYGFNKYGKLSMIFDNFGNQIVIMYNSYDNIEYVIDNNSRRISFEYENNLLKTIKDMNNRATKFEYDEGLLVKITYSNGNEFELIYDDERLIKVIDEGIGYEFIYLDNVLSKINKLGISDKKAEVTFNIDVNETKAIDSKTGYISHYLYNNKDSLETEYVEDNGLIKAVAAYEYESEHCKFSVQTNESYENLVSNYSVDCTKLKGHISDYILSAFVNIDSVPVIDRRKTLLCDHAKDITDVEPHFDLVCNVSYDDGTDIFRGTFNYLIKHKQFLAIPVTLRENEDGIVIPNSITINLDCEGHSNSELMDLSFKQGSFTYQELDSRNNVKYIEKEEMVVNKIFNKEVVGYYTVKEKTNNYYDNSDLLISSIKEIKRCEYNNDGEFVTSINEFEETKYYYNSNNKLIRVEYPNGWVIENTYNDKGLLVSCEEFNKKNPGLNYYCGNTYNELGQRIEEIDSFEEKIKYNYFEGTNKVSRIIDQLGNISDYRYDYHTDDLISISSLDSSNSKTYENGLLKTLTSKDVTYSFEYNDYNEIKGVYINDLLYVRYEEEMVLGKIHKRIYYSNYGYENVYDVEDKLLFFNKIINEEVIPLVEYVYENNLLVKRKHLISNYEINYNYHNKQLLSVNTPDYELYNYNDIYNNIIEKLYDGINIDYKYEYIDKKLTKTKFNDELIEELSYDDLGRIKIIKNGNIKYSYEYLTKNSHTSNMISKETIVDNNKVYNNSYKYDKLGNIIKAKQFQNDITYEYDELNRIIRENNKELNKTFTYEYDSFGNILTKEEYEYTLGELIEKTSEISYNYDEGLLKTFDNSEVLYDNDGNIIKYKDNELSFELNKLKSFNSVEFKYDELGTRVKKINSNIIHDYIYDGENILQETISIYESFPQSIDGTPVGFEKDIIKYIYGSNGLIGFDIVKNNDTKRYFYKKNIFGDIVEIVDSNNLLVAKYLYDAWGNCEITLNVNNIANINPFRYRGYYYDVETQLYWVSSRYYSPELCRWISPDSIEYLEPESINGLNLYAYCGNDPINKYDPTGHFGIWALVAITVASMLIGGTAQLVSNAMAGKTGSELWRGVVGAAVGAGVNALALCLAMPTGVASLFIAAGASAIAQTGVDTLETVIRGEEVDGWQTVADLGINFVTTLAGNYLGGKMIPTNPGWFQPQKFLSVFTKSYGQKILLQTSIGAGLSGTVNFIRKNDWSKYKPIIPVPVLPLYPLF